MWWAGCRRIGLALNRSGFDIPWKSENLAGLQLAGLAISCNTCFASPHHAHRTITQTSEPRHTTIDPHQSADVGPTDASARRCRDAHACLRPCEDGRGTKHIWPAHAN